MFRKRYVILQMDSLPREKAQLQAKIIDERRRVRFRNMLQFAALNLVAWGLIVLLVVRPMRLAPDVVRYEHSLFIPVVIFNESDPS